MVDEPRQRWLVYEEGRDVSRGAPPGRNMALSLLAVTVPQHDEMRVQGDGIDRGNEASCRTESGTV